MTSRRTSRVDRRDPDLEQLEAQHLPRKRVCAPNRASCNALVVMVPASRWCRRGGALTTREYMGALCCTGLIFGLRCQGSAMAWSNAPRRWIVLHQAGQRSPARGNHIQHGGVVPDRTGGHYPPRCYASAAARRPAVVESLLMTPGSALDEWDGIVPGAPAAFAGQGSAAGGFATVIRCPTIWCCAICAISPTCDHAAGIGTSQRPRCARPAAGGIVDHARWPCDPSAPTSGCCTISVVAVGRGGRAPTGARSSHGPGEMVVMQEG